MSSLDIVIVNWNSGDQLRACVSSVIEHAGTVVAKIVVVDNGSTDDSFKAVEHFPQVEVLRENVNLGFGRACNRGARLATSKYLLFLNPDARVFEDSLAKVVGFMETPENEGIGVCGVQLVDEAGRVSRSCAHLPSLDGFLFHAVGIDRFIPKLGYRMEYWDHSQMRKVDHVIGAFYFVRRIVFLELKGFDERFFMYLEDLDFSSRIQRSSWGCAYLANVRAFHAGGGTSEQVRARRLFYALRSRLLYAHKHFSLSGALLVIIATLFVEPFSRSVFALLRGSASNLQEIIIAYGMLWKWLPLWLCKGVTR
ncbi:MAG: glycosyltransferase family 2 protein [Gammaproteobacteria bacterium]|nr:glycosyltransferase family 2 protein [Gammaproteobacteria bacterium]